MPNPTQYERAMALTWPPGWELLYYDHRLRLLVWACRDDPLWSYVIMCRGSRYYATKAREVLACLTVLTAAQFALD